MRKPDFAYAKTKMQISFAVTYLDITIPLLSKSEISSLAIFSDLAAQYMSDLLGNPEDLFLTSRLI